MKKKIIMATLAISSILVFAQKTKDSSNQSESKFWGEKCGPVTFSGGEPYQSCCYYVFWYNTSCELKPL